MSTMRYVDYGAGGGPEVLRTARCERPVLREGEVLVEVIGEALEGLEEGR